MNFKRIFLFILSCIILTASFITSAGALNAEFSVKTNYEELKVGDTFDVIVSVNNIEDQFGLILAEYFLHYDNTCFEIMKWKTNKPEVWKSKETDNSDTESEDDTNDTSDTSGPINYTEVDSTFEEISTIVKNNNDVYFKCAYMYTGGLGKGVLKNGIMYTVITFKVLSDEADGKTMLLDNTMITNDVNQYSDCNNAKLTINLNGEPVQEIIPQQQENNVNDNNEEKDQDKPTNNVWKILIMIAAITGAIYLGIYINKRVNSKI